MAKKRGKRIGRLPRPECPPARLCRTAAGYTYDRTELRIIRIIYLASELSATDRKWFVSTRLERQLGLTVSPVQQMGDEYVFSYRVSGFQSAVEHAITLSWVVRCEFDVPARVMLARPTGTGAKADGYVCQLRAAPVPREARRIKKADENDCNLQAPIPTSGAVAVRSVVVKPSGGNGYSAEYRPAARELRAAHHKPIMVPRTVRQVIALKARAEVMMPDNPTSVHRPANVEPVRKPVPVARGCDTIAFLAAARGFHWDGTGI